MLTRVSTVCSEDLPGTASVQVSGSKSVRVLHHFLKTVPAYLQTMLFSTRPTPSGIAMRQNNRRLANKQFAPLNTGTCTPCRFRDESRCHAISSTSSRFSLAGCKERNGDKVQQLIQKGSFLFRPPHFAHTAGAYHLNQTVRADAPRRCLDWDFAYSFVMR